MSLIVRRGLVPQAPHTELYGKEGILALEEIHGTYGFSGPYARKMHLRSYATEQVKAPERASFNFIAETPAEADTLQPFLIQTADLPEEGDALRARKVIVYCAETRVSILKPKESFPADEFFRNGEFHELYYVHEGKGTLSSEFGTLPFRPETYIVVPKGTTYRIDLDTESAYLMITESRFPIEWPPHYMNHGGQALMTSPVVETEIELPELPDPIDKRGDYSVFTQHSQGLVTKLTLGHHPFDLLGWEGALYPFIFDINNHHAISRDIHPAPPFHQTFQSGNVPNNGFSLCSFVPQINEWGDKAVPAPYSHFNVDSDEVMFFCNASYGARKGVLRDGSFTFHPAGLPHSPHGDAAKRSLAARGKKTKRLAVMIDTYFQSFKIARAGFECKEEGYAESWSEA